MTFASHPRCKAVDTSVIRYIEEVYSRDGKGTLDERKKRHAVEETPEIRELIAYYMSYFVYDNEFSLLISKEELLRESIEIIREPVTTTDEDKRLKMIDLKSKADATCDKLVQDIKRLRSEIYGDKEKEGTKVIQGAISPEERLKMVKK